MARLVEIFIFRGQRLEYTYNRATIGRCGKSVAVYKVLESIRGAIETEHSEGVQTW